MKSMYKLIYLSLFFFVFISCQNEIIEIIEPPSDEVLKATANVTNLVKRTVTKDGSKDNIIDKASCMNVQLPVKVSVNGLEIIIDSEEDFKVIEAIFDEFDDDDDRLEIFFPIVITLNDHSEITVNSLEELEELREICNGENENDDDIECLDFVYPIKLSVYDTENQLIETIIVESDKQFYRIVHHLEDYHLVVLNFPITLIIFDGTEVIVNSMDDLERVMKEVKDECDEDDDNDYDDDDCEGCTKERVTNLLISCSWTIDKIKVNNEDQTEQYLNFTFWFLEDGTLKAKGTGDYIYGTWEVDISNTGIIVKINFDDLSDFSFYWVLYEIENDNELDLRIEENRLELEKTCIEEKAKLTRILNEGKWLVALYKEGGEDKTNVYNDFTQIDFKEDFSIVASNGNDEVSGIWTVIYDSGHLMLKLDFGDSVPFRDLNKVWKVVEMENERVELKYKDRNTDVEEKLVFERN